MSITNQRWTDRIRSGLNDILERVTAFETEGGVTGAVVRGVDRLRQEQERMRREMGGQGPLGYYARIRQAYARLEIPYGSDKETVRKSYRRLMRRYHPDRHTSDQQREKIATEISQKLTAAYDLLMDHLQR